MASAGIAAARPPCRTRPASCTRSAASRSWAATSTSGASAGRPTASTASPTHDEAFYTSAVNKQLTYGAVNLLYWFLGDRAWTGVEYLYGHREVFGDEPNPARRTGCSMRSASICRSRRGRAPVSPRRRCCCRRRGHRSPARRRLGRRAAIFRSQTDLVVLQVAVDRRRTAASCPDCAPKTSRCSRRACRSRSCCSRRPTAPLDLMLLLDTSGSMAPRLADAGGGARPRWRPCAAAIGAGVVLFDTACTFAQPLTEDLASGADGGPRAPLRRRHRAVRSGLSRLRRAVAGAGAAGGVRRPGAGRADRRRSTTAAAFLRRRARGRAARRRDDLHDPAGPGPRSAAPRGYRLGSTATTRFEMRRLAEETGGRAFVAGRASPTSRASTRRSGASSGRGTGSPTRRRRPGPGYRRVSVRVNEPPGLVARTRTGYDAAGTAYRPARRPAKCGGHAPLRRCPGDSTAGEDAGR